MKSTTLCYSRTFKVLGQSGIRIKDTSEDRFSGRVSKKTKQRKQPSAARKTFKRDWLAQMRGKCGRWGVLSEVLHLLLKYQISCLLLF